MEHPMQTTLAHNTALVLGATGGIGGEVARQLQAAGWSVQALSRSANPAVTPQDGITWLRGDALNLAEVRAAAAGCAVIVHAVNPPGYKRWAEVVLPMLDNTLTVAKELNATIVLPGTVYNYGPDAFPTVTEDSPQNPVTRKGAIRVEMERRLHHFAQQGGRVIIVRTGDFFGPQAGNNWFAQGLVKPKQAVKRISNPGTPGVGHQWAYIPDVARTMRTLMAMREQLPAFATFHMAGHWDLDGTQMAQAIQRVVQQHGGPCPKISAFPWWVMPVAALVNETLKELLEMRYLWQTPVRMVNTKLKTLLGTEFVTPLEEAVAATLRGQGCMGKTDISDTLCIK
jgi:nucleoside-diphosphate-sugar epimerase